MKNHKILILLLAVVLISFNISCKKDQEIGGTAMQKMSGDWYVTVNGDEENGYFSMFTYNTSDNSSTQMWLHSDRLRDEGVLIAIKGKISADVNGMTFSGTDIANTGLSATANPRFSIANGKVITNGTVGPVSNTPTDLISFDLTIGGVTYKIEGYHKTGFVEDVP